MEILKHVDDGCAETFPHFHVRWIFIRFVHSAKERYAHVIQRERVRQSGTNAHRLKRGQTVFSGA